jgi:hypothetical protein
MKGTFFSADFVKNADGDHKLLEINTDTACIRGLNSNLDFTDFYTLLSDNSITDLQVIYKQFQVPILERLEAQKPVGVTITKHLEQRNSIFPIAIEDAADRFVLRMAYDGNALLDVIYAKSDANLHGLFYSAESSSLLVPGAHDPAGASEYSSLEYVLNGPNDPDFAVKSAVPTKSGISFYKLGGSTGSIEDRVNEFTSSIDKTQYIITNYLSDGTTTAKSTRSYQIVYGGNLDLCYVGEYEILSALTHEVSLTWDDNIVSNELGRRHYYEFATNDISDYEGIFKEEKVRREDGGYDLAAETTVGTLYDSYFISGSPNTDNSLILDSWSFAGDVIPSGSYSTSSSLQSNAVLDVSSNAIRKITLDDGSIIQVGGASRLLAYSPDTDKTSYLRAFDIYPGYKVFDQDGNSKVVSSHDVLILDNDADAKVVELGVEDVDNYIVSGSNTIVHNAPCFIAGTQICMGDGTMKSIEDIEEGEEVVTYDFSVNETAANKVLVKTEKIAEIFNLQATGFGDVEFDIWCTLDHPFYVHGKGWCAFDPAKALELSGLECAQLEVGDQLFTAKEDEGSTGTVTALIHDPANPIEVEVYNLDHVQDQNNFFVYGFLVHNRSIFACHTYDSNVEMADGTFKAIGDIKVGDKVKSIKNGIVVEGTVTDHITHPTNDVVRVIETENGYTEVNHPIFVDNKWVSAGTLGEKMFTFVDNFYNLEIDGNISESEHNFIVDGMISSGLGDNAELNAKYQRQPKQLTKHL